jgi:hypothetical protein
MSDFDVRKLRKVIRVLEKLESDGKIFSELAYKYALLEGCGWIEEKMHDILFQYLDSQTRNSVTQEFLKKNIRKMNYGLKYSDFKKKLSSTLGEAHVVKIESHLESIDDRIFDFDHFKHCLAELKLQRDKYAHTYSRVGTVSGMGFTEISVRIDYINKGLNRIKRCVVSRT